MAIYATQAKQVSDDDFIEAARAVGTRYRCAVEAGCSAAAKRNILETEIKTAVRAATLVFDSELAVGRSSDRHGGVHSQPCLPAGVPETCFESVGHATPTRHRAAKVPHGGVSNQ